MTDSLAELGAVCLFINGGAWKQDAYADEGIPVLQVSNIKGNSVEIDDIKRLEESLKERYAKHKLVKDDLVIATVGSHPHVVSSAVGRAVMVPKKAEGFYLNQNAVCIRPKNDEILDKKYLGYVGRSDILKNHISGYARGAANQVRMPIGGLKKCKIPLPPLPTQRHIAAILSAYDDLIENNLRRIRLLEEAAQLIYREWFVYLRFPGWEAVEVVDGVPEGWEVKHLPEISENHNRKRKPLSRLEREKRPGVYPYYGATRILDYIDDYRFDGRYTLVGEDGTVITSSGTPMLQFVEGQFWVSNHAHVLTGNENYSIEYLYLALGNYQIRNHITGAAQPKLSKMNLNRISFLTPDQHILSKFNSYVSPIINQVFTLKKQNQKLREARDLLLPRLMSGEIVVVEAEKTPNL